MVFGFWFLVLLSKTGNRFVERCDFYEGNPRPSSLRIFKHGRPNPQGAKGALQGHQRAGRPRRARRNQEAHGLAHDPAGLHQQGVRRRLRHHPKPASVGRTCENALSFKGAAAAAAAAVAKKKKFYFTEINFSQKQIFFFFFFFFHK